MANNFHDTYDAITQLIASQHEQMSASRKINIQNPSTQPTSLISEDDEDEVLAPIVGNLTQNVPYVPDGHPHPIQMCQQLTPNPQAPEAPTPKKAGNETYFAPTV